MFFLVQHWFDMINCFILWWKGGGWVMEQGRFTWQSLLRITFWVHAQLRLQTYSDIVLHVRSRVSFCLQSAVGHDYQIKLSKHCSQTDTSKGFGGKFGVQADRVDQVFLLVVYHMWSWTVWSLVLSSVVSVNTLVLRWIQQNKRYDASVGGFESLSFLIVMNVHRDQAQDLIINVATDLNFSVNKTKLSVLSSLLRITPFNIY